LIQDKKNPPSKKRGGKVFALDYDRLMGDPIYILTAAIGRRENVKNFDRGC